MDQGTALVQAQMPFAAELGFEVDELTPAGVVMRGAWRKDRCTAGGVLHGGYLMSLADCAAATCAFLNLPQGAAGTVTIESKTNFVGAVRDGTVTARSEAVHVGRSTILVQTDITDERGKLVARSLQTQAVLSS